MSQCAEGVGGLQTGGVEFQPLLLSPSVAELIHSVYSNTVLYMLS